MKEQAPNNPTMPVNTLDKALELAHDLSMQLTRRDRRTMRKFHVFEALTSNSREALIAFLIWKTRGETIKELFS